jgi:deazaflavin-dependent oxidoreductase (nitroreductase family)
MRFMRPFTTTVINPLTRRVAGWLPGFGIVTCRGRKSGKIYRAPMNVFRVGDEYVFALTYGSDVQWVRNVVAAGGCDLTAMGRTVRLTDPRVFLDPQRRLMPFPVRWFLGLVRVTEFMRMRPVAKAA